jgi:Raf kinase inhibitor-like YbhB/YbcL family protein
MTRRLVLAIAVVLLAGACGSPVPSPSAPLSPGTPASVGPSASAAGTPSPSGAAGGPSATPAPTPKATPKPTPRPTPKPVAFRLSSPAFAAGGSIPAAYTCDGAGGSPALAWSGVPAGTKALVLTVTDPDASGFAHWIVLDLSPSTTGLARGAGAAGGSLHQGTNGFGDVGWGGPCPPGGTHRYRFTLYALARPLGLGGHPGIAAVQSALAGATVRKSVTLQATYHR